MNVYVVTSGEYSDYHIESVFIDKQQAELYCAARDSNREKYDDDFCSIEEFETDGARLEGEVYYGILFYARLFDSGICLYSADQMYSVTPVMTKIKKDNSDYSYKIITGTIPTNKVYDKDQRRKIVEDYLAKMQAEQLGLI